MRPNQIKAKMAAGQVVLGYICNIPSPTIVEVAGLGGMDFVAIDCEHGPMNEMVAEDMVRAAEIMNITPIVRVPVNRPEVILRFMDRGAAGVIVPHVNTKADAEAAVEAVKYAPMGKRGAANFRWALGVEGDPFAFANRETMVICMVEETEGVNNLKEILTVPGLDAIHIGTNDLSHSMGYVGNAKHPKVIEAVRYITKTTRAAGKGVGQGGNRVDDYEGIRAAIETGANLVTVSPGNLLQLASREFRAKVLGK